MRTIPGPDELLEVVAEFLRTTDSDHPRGDAAFHARVAANAIEIVRRELAQGAAADRAAADRIRHLLGPSGGGIIELESRLSAEIRTGRLDARSPGLLEHLWKTTLAEMSIDQPGYATYRLVLKAAPKL